MHFPKLSNEFFGRCKCVQGQADAHMATVHQTQGATARGGAVTLISRTDGSAHECIGYDSDAKDARLVGYNLAPDNVILCHVGGANTGNYGIEIGGFSSWTRKIWFLPRNRNLLMFAAYRTAHALRRMDEPPRYYGIKDLDRAGALANVHGWTTHNNLSRSKLSTSTHTDPGAGFPRKWFAKRVRFYYHNPSVDRPVTRKDLKRH